jgi:hypothetical protein
MTPLAPPSPPRRLLRACAFAAGSAVDALVAPFAALRGKHRVARAALEAAGLPTRGAYAADVRRVRARRRHRRLRGLLLRGGPGALAGAVSVDGFERLRDALAAGRGAILVSTHGGPPEAIPAALRLLGIDAFELREAAPPPWDPPMRAAVFPNRSAPSARATGLVACLAELRRGGAVRLALEGHARRSMRARHDARIGALAVPAGGGAAALARLSRAPAFPVVASVGPLGRTRVALGEAIAPRAPEGAGPEARDAAFVEAAHAGFERLLEADPAGRLERLLWTVEIRAWGAAARRAREAASAGAAQAPSAGPGQRVA